MLISAVVDFFKHKLAYSVIVLTCSWSASDKVSFSKILHQHGVKATISCDPKILSRIEHGRLQGVIYMNDDHEALIKKVNPIHFSSWYKWLIIDDHVANFFNDVRYDSDVTFLRLNQTMGNDSRSAITTANEDTITFEDVFNYPEHRVSLHPWGTWSKETGLRISHDRERTLRRLDMQLYPLKIASPIASYSANWYNGTFTEYLRDESMPDVDSAGRAGYLTSALIIDAVNATEVLFPTPSWSNLKDNASMLLQVAAGGADLTGAVLRIMTSRAEVMDYIIPIWPFGVGFTYLAERESSSNMYVEPFAMNVWWCVLGVGVILAVAQRVTARKPVEKEGAFIGVLATWLQQDASAVPEGASGRWTFTVLSVSAMLVHAYYTSAIVSALMSSGMSGPQTLRALGDSKYQIASIDYEYMKTVFFETETTWSDMEYLKKKKKTSKFYQDIDTGVALLQAGNTAYHTEYNQIYPHLRRFSDNHLCKLQHIDTIPEILTWVTSTKRGQYTEILRAKGTWLLETGLGHRLVSRLKIRPPACRSSLLAERVNFGDVAPLLALTACGGILSLIVLGLEIMFANIKKKARKMRRASLVTDVDGDILQFAN